MGVFSTTIGVGAVEGKRVARLRAIVDTVAAASIVPRKVLARVGVKPMWRRVFTLANGEHVERAVGVARFAHDGSEGAAEVIFGEAGDKPLLGAMTLEALGLRVDPRRKRLQRTELLLVGLRHSQR